VFLNVPAMQQTEAYIGGADKLFDASGKLATPIVCALADHGARLLSAHGGIDLAHIEWNRKNREAGRPFIEHHLEIADFEIAT
jgi:hypothetical protein